MIPTLLCVVADERGVIRAQRDLAAMAAAAATVLSKEERDRCDKMWRTDAAQVRRAAHVLKREVVGERLGCKPDGVRFLSDVRPLLAPLHDGVHVSLSHTRGAVAVATASAPIGIDIEPTDRTDGLEPLAIRYFAPTEAALIRSSFDHAFNFAWRWTAKEALLKARGLRPAEALSTHLGDPSVTRGGAPIEIIARNTHITVFTPAAGFVCSIARC